MRALLIDASMVLVSLRVLNNQLPLLVAIDSEALIRKLAPLGAAQIQFGIGKYMPAAGALAPGVVLVELDLVAAVGARDFEDVSRSPEGGILTRTLCNSHGATPFRR